MSSCICRWKACGAPFQYTDACALAPVFELSMSPLLGDAIGKGGKFFTVPYHTELGLRALDMSI
jgi:hypothetical protein